MGIEEGEMGLCTAAMYVPGIRAEDGVCRANYVLCICSTENWVLMLSQVYAAGSRDGAGVYT